MYSVTIVQNKVYLAGNNVWQVSVRKVLSYEQVVSSCMRGVMDAKRQCYYYR
jgi:hypothetical protein